VAKILQQSARCSRDVVQDRLTIDSTDVTLADSGEYVDILSAMLNTLGPGRETQGLEFRRGKDVSLNMADGGSRNSSATRPLKLASVMT
jgi:hypothetical protein